MHNLQECALRLWEAQPKQAICRKRKLSNMISFLMHIPYIIENFVKIYKPSCMHPHRYYHSAEVCKSLVMLFILFLTYVFSLYY